MTCFSWQYCPSDRTSTLCNLSFTLLQAKDSSPGGLVASYGGDSDDDDEESASAAEAKMVDLQKMACLLCKRQFPSQDALTRHVQLSDLHKNNLDDFRKTLKASGGSVSWHLYIVNTLRPEQNGWIWLMRET